MLKEVECYKCSDGKILEDKKLAEIYEGKLMIAKDMEKFVDENLSCFNTNDRSIIVDALSENIEVLETILNIKGEKDVVSIEREIYREVEELEIIIDKLTWDNNHSLTKLKELEKELQNKCVKIGELEVTNEEQKKSYNEHIGRVLKSLEESRKNFTKVYMEKEELKSTLVSLRGEVSNE